jgi:purine-binding chemotaxis protein CheW
LRGVIVPVADLRLKLGVSTADYNESTVVIILNIHGSVVGAVVDAVSDVVTLSADAIKSAPQFESGVDARFIIGLVTLAERTLIVMHIEALMANAEMGISL